jgi:AcrR family transcriptional regulator
MRRVAEYGRIMARLTRAERQARTRAQLIATAKELFLRDGYGPTSLEKVAEAAGFSKGAVYSNFRNKNELCLAVLDAIHAEQIAQITEAVSSAASIEERIARLQRWAEENIGDEARTTLEVEFALAVRHDEHLRRELAGRDKGMRDVIADLVRESTERFDVDVPMPADNLAAVLLSLGIGLSVQRLLDPGIPASLLTDLVRTLITVTPRAQSGTGSNDVGGGATIRP